MCSRAHGTQALRGRQELEGIVVGRHKIKLVAVPASIITLGEYRREGPLYRGDQRANHKFSAELLWNIRGTGKVVGVDVGFEDVLQAETLVLKTAAPTGRVPRVPNA